MRNSATIAIGVISLLVAACGSGGASAKVVPVQALKAEVCTEGEARDTKLYIRNLDDFDWRDITFSLVKAGEGGWDVRAGMGEPVAGKPAGS